MTNNQMIKGQNDQMIHMLLKDVLVSKYQYDSGTPTYFDTALALRGGQPHCLRCVQSNVQVTWCAL